MSRTSCTECFRGRRCSRTAARAAQRKVGAGHCADLLVPIDGGCDPTQLVRGFECGQPAAQIWPRLPDSRLGRVGGFRQACPRTQFVLLTGFRIKCVSTPRSPRTSSRRMPKAEPVAPVMATTKRIVFLLRQFGCGAVELATSRSPPNRPIRPAIRQRCLQPCPAPLCDARDPKQPAPRR